MKDKLLYLTIGVLIGIVVMQWRSNDNPRTSFVSVPSAAAGVVVDGVGIVSQFGNHVLDQNGQSWFISTSCWEPDPLGYVWPLPVPVDQIKFWHPGGPIVTKDNIAWAWGSGNWYSCGPWPGAPVPTSPGTWGSVKGLYDDQK